MEGTFIDLYLSRSKLILVGTLYHTSSRYEFLDCVGTALKERLFTNLQDVYQLDNFNTNLLNDSLDNILYSAMQSIVLKLYQPLNLQLFNSYIKANKNNN